MVGTACWHAARRSEATPKHMEGIVLLCTEARTSQRIRSALVKRLDCGSGGRQQPGGAHLKWSARVCVCERESTHTHTHIYHVDAHQNRFSTFLKIQADDVHMCHVFE